VAIAAGLAAHHLSSKPKLAATAWKLVIAQLTILLYIPGDRDMLRKQLAERINSRHYAALFYVTYWKLNSQMKLTQITVLPARLGARSQSAYI
jgi:hypothetical protein